MNSLLITVNIHAATMTAGVYRVEFTTCFRAATPEAVWQDPDRGEMNTHDGVMEVTRGDTGWQSETGTSTRMSDDKMAYRSGVVGRVEGPDAGETQKD